MGLPLTSGTRLALTNYARYSMLHPSLFSGGILEAAYTYILDIYTALRAAPTLATLRKNIISESESNGLCHCMAFGQGEVVLNEQILFKQDYKFHVLGHVLLGEPWMSWPGLLYM
jgi:hypothetical protein